MNAAVGGLRRLARIAAVLLAVAGAGPAHADDITAIYVAFWAGVPAAELRLILSDGTSSYRHQIEIETEGLPRLLSRFAGTALA